jgi:DNA polymerase III epsilon subunit-like protein
MENILFLDFETTGLDPKINGIIEMGYMIESRGQVICERCYQIRPYDDQVIDPQAMAIHNIDLSNPALMDPSYVFELFLMDVTKHARLDFSAYRADFDWGFLEAYWKRNLKNKITDVFTGRVLDPRALLHNMHQWGLINLENYKLVTAAEAFGIPLFKAHSALDDIQATRDLYNKLKKYFLEGASVIDTNPADSKVSLADEDFASINERIRA